MRCRLLNQPLHLRLHVQRDGLSEVLPRQLVVDARDYGEGLNPVPVRLRQR